MTARTRRKLAPRKEPEISAPSANGTGAIRRPPRLSALTPAGIKAVLRRNVVGRIAFVVEGLVDIEPVSYVARGDWIFIRSANGTKMDAFAHSPYVAFEVDESDGPFDWRSVVAHGTVYILSGHSGPVNTRTFNGAVAALRSLVPSALAEGDPMPFRDVVYGLHIDRASGRMAELDVLAPGWRAATPARTQTAHVRTPDGS